MIQTQTSFSRTVANEGKMGAYYTDVGHCRDIRKLFRFPEGEEVTVLEPSIGDGSAVIAVTGADENSNIKIFGVELNDSVADKTSENPLIEECLKADFLDGVKISNNKFSFCFSNPPYLNDTMDGERGKRIEKAFLEKIEYYLQKDGILVWVVPYSVFTEETHFRYFNSHYELLKLYRFRDDEFKKFHQIVAVGRKRQVNKSFMREQFEEMVSKVDSLEKIEVLPHEFDEKELIEVNPSPSEQLTLFATREFDVAGAYSALMSKPKELMERMGQRITIPRYSISSIGRPPIPLKKDSIYLLATSGGGQGITGTEENGDIHLQRGVAEVIEEPEIEIAESGAKKKRQVRINTRTAVSMTIVQNNGTITVLK